MKTCKYKPSGTKKIYVPGCDPEKALVPQQQFRFCPYCGHPIEREQPRKGVA